MKKSRCSIRLAALVALALTAAACAPSPVEPRAVLTGEPIVGSTLRADPGSWTVAPTRISYRWYSCPDATRGAGCEVIGDDSPTFVLTSSELTRHISVTLRGANEFGWNTVRSNFVGPVRSGGPDGPIEWGSESLDIRQLAGTVLNTPVSFRGDLESYDDFGLRVEGDLADIATILLESARQNDAGDYEFDLVTVLPASAAEAVTGRLVMENGGESLAAPVTVTVTPEPYDDTTTPSTIAEPSPDRIVDLPGGQLVVVDELLVAIDFDAHDPDQVARDVAEAVGGRIIGSDTELRLYQIQILGAQPEDIVDQQAVALGVLGVVEATLNYVNLSPTEVIPDDSEWDSWSGAGGNNWGLKFINAPQAWDRTTGSDAVKVAVIDIDNDCKHGDLDDNVSRCDRGTTGSSHGTHVAGTLCAEGNNGKGITGVAWDCDLRFYAAAGTVAGTAARMQAAVNDGASVINMSLGYIGKLPDPEATCQLDDTEEGRTMLREAAAAANGIFGRAIINADMRGKDVLWVIAAGNQCARDIELQAPAGLALRFPRTTMTVAAVGPSGQIANFSNIGDGVSVSAPGVEILSTVPRTCLIFSLFCTDRYAGGSTWSGTSMATPHVAGLAALVRTEHPGKTASEVKGCIVAASQRSGVAVPGFPFRTIDAAGAVSCEAAPELPSKVDIVIALDLTGSMGDILDQAKAEATALMNNVAAAAPGTDFQFGVVSYEDYPGYFSSSACPTSNYAASYGVSTDSPFDLRNALSADRATSQSTINGLSLGNGWDGPESYGRAFWEVAQPDTPMGWRSDALKILLNFGDNVPHDPNINEGVSDASVYDTGIDPGRNGVIDCGGDDIDFQDDALAALRSADIRLLHVQQRFTLFEPNWRYWTSLTGGAYTTLDGGRTLSDVVIELLGLVDG